MLLRCRNPKPPMSRMGQKRRSRQSGLMSGLTQTADAVTASALVGLGPWNEPAYAGARCARGGVRGNDGGSS